jgi:lipid II:glycine glycyltransferase (peptidoglycan interpeptide bridge formation enzyme)
MLPRKSLSLNSHQWNSIIASLPGAHILQTWEWGQVKSRFGWQPIHLIWFQENNKYILLTNQIPENKLREKPVAAALVLQRTISLGGFSKRLRVLYVPKGPLLDWSDTVLRKHVLQNLQEIAKKQGAIFIKIDPDILLGIGIPGTTETTENPIGNNFVTDLRASGWQFSDEQIQFRNTVLIDLSSNEEELLARMKQKTRYNINLAIRKGVTVRIGDLADIDLLYRMYAETSVRDGFVIRNEAYYRDVWNTFISNQKSSKFDQPVAEPLIAEVNGEPVAAVIVFRFAGKAWYLYGMSRMTHREKMPNYLLQWEAIKQAKVGGCTVYDLWGAPDEFVETDPLWGVFRFKEGLGGTVTRFIGAWDLPINRILYRLYTQTLPGLLDIMRKRGKESTRQIIG